MRTGKRLRCFWRLLRACASTVRKEADMRLVSVAVVLLLTGCAYQRNAAWYIDGHNEKAVSALVELAATIQPNTLQAQKAKKVAYHLGRQGEWSGDLKKDVGVPADAPKIPDSPGTREHTLEDRKRAQYQDDYQTVPHLPLGASAGGGGLLALLSGGSLGALGIGAQLLRGFLKRKRQELGDAQDRQREAERQRQEAHNQAMVMVDVMDQIKQEAPDPVKDIAGKNPVAKDLYLQRAAEKAAEAKRAQAAVQSMMPGI